MTLDWRKSTATGDWAVYDKEALLPFEEDRGQKCVYLIWSESERQMVYVGSGDVDRLWDHLNPSDPAYERIHAHENLKATYALIDEKYMLGAENYLAQVYRPSAVKASPEEIFMEVSLPDNIGVCYDSARAKETSHRVRATRSLLDCVKDEKENS